MADVERNHTLEDEKYRTDHVEKSDAVPIESSIQPPARMFTPQEVRRAPDRTYAVRRAHHSRVNPTKLTGGQALPQGRFPNHAHPLVRFHILRNPALVLSLPLVVLTRCLNMQAALPVEFHGPVRCFLACLQKPLRRCS